MTLMDQYSGGLNLMVIALCEVIGIVWIYGTVNFTLVRNIRHGTKLNSVYTVANLIYCTVPSQKH